MWKRLQKKANKLIDCRRQREDETLSGKKSLDKRKYNLTVFGASLFICLFMFILKSYIPKIKKIIFC